MARAITGLLLGLLLLAPWPAAAQAPRPPPVAPAAAGLVDLFGADTLGYAELLWRPAGPASAQLDRLLSAFRAQPGFDTHYAWLGVLPELVRALAVGVSVQDGLTELAAVVEADEPAVLLSLALLSSGVPPPSADYAGVPLYTIELDRGRSTVYLATAGHWLLAATSQNGLARLLDRARAGPRAEPGLAATPRYREAVSRLPVGRLATLYADGAALAEWLVPLLAERAAGSSVGALGAAPSSLSGALAYLQGGGLAVGLVADGDGLLLATAQPADAATAALTVPARAEALRFVPADTLIALAGSGLGPLVAGALARAGAGQDLPGLPGVNLERDLLSWMDGEYGLAVWPPAPGSRGVAGFALPTVALLFEVRDPPTVEARLREVVSALQQQESAVPMPLEEQQGAVTVRRLALSERLNITWGYLGRWLFITTGDAPALAAAADAGGLAADAEFRRAVRPLPTPSASVFYLDIAGTVRWLDALGPAGPLVQARDSAAWWRPLLAPLGGLASASRVRDGWVEQVVWLEVRR